MKNFPVKENFTEDENDILQYYCPSASSGDMTGLIPFSAETDAQIESYKELYQFLPDENVAVDDDMHKKHHQ